MKLLILGVLASAITPVLTRNSIAQALSPEDASLRISKWYFSETNIHFQNKSVWDELQKIAQKHDIELTNIGPQYQWAQDILLFDMTGKFLAPAFYPTTPFNAEYFWGISRGVYDEEFGPTRANTENFRSTRTLTYSFPEGGALISGFFSNGEPYILTGRGLLERAQHFINRSQNLNLSIDETKILVAKDFNIAPQNLFSLTTSGHLDLQMLALPNGKILIQDQTLIPKVLQKLIPLAKGEEKRRLSGMLDLYTSDWIDSPQNSFERKLLDNVEKLLMPKFEVIRVAGIFLEPSTPTSTSLRDRINFFNGFHGKDSHGKYFQITNSSRGLPLLEKYWTQLIQNELPQKDASIYFPGLYSFGAGIDCSGAVSVK